MALTISIVLFSIAVFLITAVLIKISSRRAIIHNVSALPPPPEVKGIALLGLLHTMFTKGPEAAMHYLYNKHGSAFTVSFLWKRTTFLVGKEASGVFFQSLESEVTQGNLNEFTVPMFGNKTGFAVDYATRMEQNRFLVESLRPANLRSYVDPMLQEVENYFAKWGEQGVVDLNDEFEELLMLIQGRCLVGQEVREKMFGEFCTLFHQIEEGVNFASFMLPHIPIPVNRRRDRARIRLTEILSKVVSSRKSFNPVEDDVLQKLVDSKYKGGRGTTVEEVCGMILALIFVGKHTSAMTSTWTGACLLSHPKYFDAALEEQKHIISKYNGNIDYNVLLEMSTLHSCIKEAARIYPSLPILIRQVKKDVTMRTKEGNEYGIPRGHTLVNLVMENNMLTHIYKDPKVYDPDRFSPGREEDKVGGKSSYLTFGGGRHACCGEAYTYMQIKIIFSHLLRNFELKMISSLPKPDWSKSLPEPPKGKVMVSYKRRHLPSD